MIFFYPFMNSSVFSVNRSTLQRHVITACGLMVIATSAVIITVCIQELVIIVVVLH